MNKMSQNIFDYATSELSQDAFISLMISWFDSNDRSLKEISQDFITKLYEEYNTNYLSSRLPDLKIKSVKLKQYSKIDVFFEVTTEISDVIPFIIEDKTWTEPHNNQLQKYAKKIKEPNIKIFFKTGHITEKDKKLTNEEQYMIIDTKWIYDFLSKYKNNTTDVIFSSFFEYLEREFYSKLYNKSGTLKTLADWRSPNYLKEGFVQYAMIENIKTSVDASSKNLIKFTRNGKAWKTWWTFFDEPNSTKFFVQILKMAKADKNSRRKVKNKKYYRIRLIEYPISDNKQKNWGICNEIINSFATNVKITKKPNYKANETELAFIEIVDDNLEDYSAVFSTFLQTFIKNKKLQDELNKGICLGKNFAIYKACMIQDNVKSNDISFTKKIIDLINNKLLKVDAYDHKLYLYLLNFIYNGEKKELEKSFNLDFMLFCEISLLAKRKARVAKREEYAFDDTGLIHSSYDKNPRAIQLGLFIDGMDNDEKKFLSMSLEDSIVNLEKYI